MFLLFLGLFAANANEFLSTVESTIDLNRFTPYPSVANANLFNVDEARQFSTTSLDMYVPLDWWHDYVTWKLKRKDDPKRTNDMCFVITNGGREGFFNLLKDRRDLVSWCPVECSNEFSGLLHTASGTFVGLGYFNKLSNILPNHFYVCTYGSAYLGEKQRRQRVEGRERLQTIYPQGVYTAQGLPVGFIASQGYDPYANNFAPVTQ